MWGVYASECRYVRGQKYWIPLEQELRAVGSGVPIVGAGNRTLTLFRNSI